jgi:hypothetical protein
MGAKLSDLLVDKVTRVQRTFETTSGEAELDLNVRHKRITNDVQLQMQKLAGDEFTKMAKSLDDRKKAMENARDTGGEIDMDAWPIYEPRNTTCLQLEAILIDLDIVDEKNKPVKPTYENLIALPVEVVEAIKQDIDGNVIPKKQTSTNSANGTRAVANADMPQVG